MLKIGESASLGRTITEADIQAYAGVTGDLNPLHMNEQHASMGPFGKRVAHGIPTKLIFRLRAVSGMGIGSMICIKPR